MTKKERKLARQATTSDIINRFPKGGVDPLTYTTAALTGGSRTTQGNCGAVQCRMAYDTQKKGSK